MSLDSLPSMQRPAHRPRLERKLKLALDNMALQGMRWQDAARAADYSTASMWRALQSSHTQAYLRQQRQVFRASLVDEATFRMRELSQQDDNMAAAVTATRALMNEHDQEDSRTVVRSSPGLQIVIVHASGGSPVVPQPTTIDGAISNINSLPDDTIS